MRLISLPPSTERPEALPKPVGPASPAGKVFGVGWAKTGTTTLARCFEILGYRHQSQDLSLVHCLEEGDLGLILEREIPADPFPHANPGMGLLPGLWDRLKRRLRGLVARHG